MIYRTVFIATFLLALSFGVDVNEKGVSADSNFFTVILNWIKQFICPQSFNFGSMTADSKKDDFIEQIKTIIQMAKLFICHNG
jgi:hypothetical protein